MLRGHCAKRRSTTKRRDLLYIYVGDYPTRTSGVTPDSRIHFSSTQTCVFKLLPPRSVSSGVCSSAVVSVSFFFFFKLSGVCGFLHAAGLPGISRNYWSAAFDISIANLIQTRVLPRAAKFQKGDKRNSFPSPEAIGRHCCEMSLQLKRAESEMFQLFLCCSANEKEKKQNGRGVFLFPVTHLSHSCH